MPIWISAIGIAGMGAIFGYFAFYILKRIMPPVTEQPPRVRELLLFLATLGMSGAVGAPLMEVGGVSYVGPYGLGLLAGLLLNITLTFVIEAVADRE